MSYNEFRVGLSLKKTDREQEKYVMKSYRYLTLPKKTKKGKIQLVLSLYRQVVNISSLYHHLILSAVMNLGIVT
jgi:hypothetical protein